MQPQNSVQDISPSERMILSHLKKSPGLFLGAISLKNFWHMTDGYQLAMGIVGEKTDHNILPDGLNEFTAEYLGVNMNARNCFSLILNHEPDDSKALILFFEILDKYLASLGYTPIPEWDDAVKSIAVYTENSC